MARRPIPASVMAVVAKRYGLAPASGWQWFSCHWCGASGRASWSLRDRQRVGFVSLWDLEWDHLLPMARGGDHDPDNLVWACRRCNRSRCDRMPDEWSVPC